MLTVGGLWLFIIFPLWPHCFRQDDFLHFFYSKATSFHQQSSLIVKKSFRWESSQIYFAVFSFKEDLNIDWVPPSNHNNNSRNKSIDLIKTTKQISRGSQRKKRTRSSKSHQSQRLAEQKEQRRKQRNQVGINGWWSCSRKNKDLLEA